MINQGYLLILLLVSLSAFCTSDCPTSEHYGQPPYGQPPYDKCANLYSILEAGLLENLTTLYQLHESFFPSSSSEPIYARVTYNLKRGFDDHDCSRDFCNSFFGSVCKNCYDTCWTSSVLLRSVDPVVLTNLQLQLLNTLLEVVGVSDLRANYSYGARLSLELNITEIYSSDLNITNAVLQELTSWVSA